ncbi:MAG: transketolase C-terminal domain-containing protein [Bacteroidales bacterium]|nr:transketolase C-terminal domain-containing protein [Bacteroidales bacterium]
MKQWIQHSERPTRAGFGEGVLEAGILNNEVVALGGDITSSVGLDLFAKAFPDRFFSLGIAEQNAIAVAAGLALGGKIPVFSTYGVFAAIRAADQIRVSLCYNRLHAIIGGAHAGISVGPDGATHQALEDIAIMTSFPNMCVLSPCDATQARLAVLAALGYTAGPVYIRFGREAVADFTTPELPFEIGKAQVMNYGADITVIATGHMVWEAIQSAVTLRNQGLSVRVINMHSLKPLDEDIIIKAAKETRRIVTIEEHQMIGGLGSLVASLTARNFPVPVFSMGINDHFGESGQAAELLLKYGLTADHITRKILSICK